VFRIAAALAGLSIAAVGGLLWRAVNVFTAAGAPALSTAGPAIMVAVGLALVATVFFLPRRSVAAAVIIAAGAALTIYNNSVMSPSRPEPVEVVAASIRTHSADREVCACGALGRSLPFYAGTRAVIANVTSDYTAELIYYLENHIPRVLVVDARVLEVVERQLGRTFRRLHAITYLNTSVWQRGETLIAPDPLQVQRVVVIWNR
jgi:hypothetical protein